MSFDTKLSKAINRISLLAMLSFLPGAVIAAIPEVPTENGWGGWVVLGLGYTDLESNTAAGNKWIDVGKDSINNITDSPESDDTVHIAPGGAVGYTFGDQWQVFLGSSLIDRLTLDFTQQIGFRKQTARGNRFGAGILLSGAPTEVWEDPYQTSSARQDTDRDSTGIRLEWDKIFGSGANVTLDFRDIEIDNERIGQDVVGCGAACQSQLRRDGDFARLEFGWGLKLFSRHLLRPAVRLVSNDRDGDAQDNDAASLLVTYSLLGENFTLATTAAYTNTEYDNPNPIYGIKQDSSGFALNGTVFYNLSKSGRWQLVSTVAFGEDDSDIDFHDQKIFQVILGAYFSFGNEKNPWHHHESGSVH